MASRKQTISVVIPLYNGAGYIAESLLSALKQTLPADEIIVVDDGSTDNGPQLVEKLAETNAIKLLRKNNGGQSSARNLGIAHSTGDLIALLDQDDIWYANHLEELSKPFQEQHYPELGWVYSDLDEINKQGRMMSRNTLRRASHIVHPKRDIIRCLMTDMMILPSASMMTRAAFDAAGGFDERLIGFEDDDLFLRMFCLGYNNIYLDKSLTKWRIYAESTSFSKKMSESRMIYIRKLMESFPDDTHRSLFYTRDLIAPRFFPWLLSEYRQALKSGDRQALQTAYDNMAFVHPLMRSKMRRFSTILMPLARAPLRSPKLDFLGHIARRSLKKLTT